MSSHVSFLAVVQLARPLRGLIPLQRGGCILNKCIFFFQHLVLLIIIRDRCCHRFSKWFFYLRVFFYQRKGLKLKDRKKFSEIIFKNFFLISRNDITRFDTIWNVVNNNNASTSTIWIVIDNQNIDLTESCFERRAERTYRSSQKYCTV